MYVSVDSLPELTPEYQQTQQQAVHDAKVVSLLRYLFLLLVATSITPVILM